MRTQSSSTHCKRHATVVVQKSLFEGFGLTVSEALWKSRPVLASAVGGIQDQIIDGQDGLLLPDPRDLIAFAQRLQWLLDDPSLGERMGRSGHERVRDHFLGDRSLIQYVDLFDDLVEQNDRGDAEWDLPDESSPTVVSGGGRPVDSGERVRTGR